MLVSRVAYLPGRLYLGPLYVRGKGGAGGRSVVRKDKRGRTGTSGGEMGLSEGGPRETDGDIRR